MKCRIKQPYEIIQIDKYTGKINTSTLLLMNRSFDIIGKISRYDNWNISLVGNGIDEISFDVHKYADGKICPVWDDLIDLKIVDVSGFGRFEISVNYADSAETVKSIHGLSLETELAQIGLYEFHVNDEEAADMTITEYSKNNYNPEGEFIPTVFYKPDDETHSLLNRALADKAPHWSIGYVTPYIALDEESQPELSSEFQRTYTVNGDTIYDFLTGTVAQESNVVFVFDTINRRINCYSLCDCIDQETGNVIVHADGTEVTGIGEDTGILVSKNKLADEITISSGKDNVKNCFRIEGGDDVITDMVRAVNMNGSNYIYQFADFQYRDMPKALVDAIEAYNEQFSKEKSAYYGNGDMDKFLNGTLTLCVTSEQEAVIALCVCKNNRIMTDHADLSNYEATEYWHIVVSGNSRKLHVSENIKTPYKTVTDAFHTMGLYPKLCVKYDELAYFESAMMPDVNIQETTSKEQYDIMVRKLTDSNMVVGVSSLRNFDNNQLVVSNNVEAMANILIDARYKAEVIKDSVSLHKNEAREYFWRGNIRITKASDQTDCYPKTDDQLKTRFEVKINDDELTFTRQKIEKALHKGSMLDIDFKIADMNESKIRNYFNRYSLNRLKSFYDGYQACLSILMQADADSTVRKELYETYYNRMRIISNPPTKENPYAVPGVLDVRQRQVDRIYSEIADIKDKQTAFQKNWNFKDYLDRHGKDLYKTFCYYRREDAYSNGNYISDGLTDAECLAKAKELVEAAQKEAKKACVLQRTVSTSLHNLFALPEFEPLYDKFALYNYIRIRTEDEILKLRLIGIDFSGDSIETINVTFSEQIESVDGTSGDLQSIIRQAKSMASSYPSTALQAKQGSIANDEIADMYRNGLNAAKTVLANNDNQEVTVNEAGILCRRMKDEGVYDEKQLRITGNMMAFTDDNWATVKMAIGETKINSPGAKEDTGLYGIIADNIVGKLVAGEKCLIGNESSNVFITGDGIEVTNGSIALSNDNYSIELDPNHRLKNIRDDFLFCIRNKKIKINKENNDIIMGIDTDGNGYFKGTVDATSITAKECYKIYHGENSIDFIRATLAPLMYRWLISINFNNSRGTGIFYREDEEADFLTNTRVSKLRINSDRITFECKNIILNKATIHSESGQITTSDRNLKSNIKPLTEKHIQFFSLLQPVSFTFKDGKSGRTHIGFISQDVENAMKQIGLTDLDFAGFCKDVETVVIKDTCGNKTYQIKKDENGNDIYIYSLRYDEFIALNTFMIQKLYKENQDIKERLLQLEEKIDNLDRTLK